MSRTGPSCTLATLACLTAALAACGGGGGGGGAGDPVVSAPPAALPAPEPEVALPVTLGGVVADGPLSNALVCCDTNDNTTCDAGEPSAAPTDADGRYSLAIDPVLAGHHRVVAQVPASAVDKDTGAPVGQAFTLVAPATGAAGSQRVAASAFVQAQAGLAMSPLDDFTTSATPEARQAATLARLTLLTINEQAHRLGGVVGTRDLSGASITPADIARTAIGAVLGALPAVAAVAGAPALTAAEAQAPQAAAHLTAFRYTDADHRTFRAFLSSAADNTLDAEGLRRCNELRMLRQAGRTTRWGYGNTPERAGDLQWTGSSWAGCPAGTLSKTTPCGTAGRSHSSHCGAYEQGTRVRSLVDVAGRSLRSVVETIRSFPGGSAGVDCADWGPADLGLPGNVSLPAGSELVHQTNASLKTAVTCDPRNPSRVGADPANVAAGGDARGGASPPRPCGWRPRGCSSNAAARCSTASRSPSAAPPPPCA